jgi:hypothetical protein
MTLHTRGCSTDSAKAVELAAPSRNTGATSANIAAPIINCRTRPQASDARGDLLFIRLVLLGGDVKSAIKGSQLLTRESSAKPAGEGRIGRVGI